MAVGVLGGGQLGRMMALAAYPLGERVVLLDPSPSACGGHVAPLVVGRWDDAEPLSELARRSEVVTFEFENVPDDAARYLADRVRVAPPPAALEITQDRLYEKRLFQQLGIGTALFAPASSRQELLEAVEVTGLPAVVKTRRFGYDGKGQHVVRTRQDVEEAWLALGATPLIVESFVPFQFETSAIVARSWSGEVVRYPLVENLHARGILRESRPDSPNITEELRQQAQDAPDRLLTHLNYVGVLTVEFFVTDEGLIANEMAPRVHNSGHYSIDGALTSQFENHIRAIIDAPLGDPSCHVHSVMLNCIGGMPERADMAAIPGVRIHAYGKSASPGRKIGHVTVVARERDELERRLAKLRPLIEAATDG